MFRCEHYVARLLLRKKCCKTEIEMRIWSEIRQIPDGMIVNLQGVKMKIIKLKRWISESVPVLVNPKHVWESVLFFQKIYHILKHIYFWWFSIRTPCAFCAIFWHILMNWIWVPHLLVKWTSYSDSMVEGSNLIHFHQLLARCSFEFFKFFSSKEQIKWKIE